MFTDVRALALGCFHSHISTRTFRRPLTASVNSCAEIECPFSGVTKSGGVCRKVPESDARSVGRCLTSGSNIKCRDKTGSGESRFNVS